MLHIKIELWSGGKSKTLAVAEISNYSDLADTSNYRVRSLEFENPVAGNPFWKGDGFIDGHNRRQSVWRLIEKAAKFAADQIENVNAPTFKP